jgi:hypothetical protein
MKPIVIILMTVRKHTYNYWYVRFVGGGGGAVAPKMGGIGRKGGRRRQNGWTWVRTAVSGSKMGVDGLKMGVNGLKMGVSRSKMGVVG